MCNRLFFKLEWNKYAKIPQRYVVDLFDISYLSSEKLYATSVFNMMSKCLQWRLLL